MQNIEQNQDITVTAQVTFSEFSIGDKVVYSSHGVGIIQDIETKTYEGTELRFYVIDLVNQRMSIKVPIKKNSDGGLRKITNAQDVESIFTILRQKSCNTYHKSKARKFINYKQKLNSGNIADLAEVVRDLYRSDYLTTSYSQKAIYESALTRLANELALLLDVKLDKMMIDLEELLTSRV